jgi:hypothetical protein
VWLECQIVFEENQLQFLTFTLSYVVKLTILYF